MHEWNLRTDIAQLHNLETPPAVTRRFSASTTSNWGGGKRTDSRSGDGSNCSNSGSEVPRTSSGTSGHSTEEQWSVIVEIATSLLQYGAPSHRIEVIVSAVGHALSIPTAFYYLPTCAIIQFPILSSSGNVSGPSSLYLIKSRGSMNFHKLPQVYDLVKDILKNSLGCDDIRRRIETIRSAEENAKEFPEWAIALSYPFAAMTSAIMFFHGTWRDALMSGALGVIPGFLRLAANRLESLWWTYEIIACFLVSLIATAVAPYFCYSTLILSASVTLLPGYNVTCAVVEIMTKNIIAGSVRLCYTVVYLACMIFGMTFASILFHAQGNTSGIGFNRKPIEEVCMPEEEIHANHLWLLLCVPLYIAAYNVYLRCQFRQWMPMIAVGSLGYGAGYACKHIWHSPPEFNGFAAGFIIGLSANLYGRITGQFAFNSIVGGVLIQVPGSWGARGMLAVAYGEYDRGVYYCYQMLATCVGIGCALLLSTYFVWGFKGRRKGIPLMDF